MMNTQTNPQVCIFADACNTRFGAHDHAHAYAFEIPERMQRYTSTQLECINTLIALRIFTKGFPPGMKVRVACDNAPTIYTYSNGKARDVILAACARAAWFHMAEREIDMDFVHIPGLEMELPDALSRMHTGAKFQRRVKEDMRARGIRFAEAPYANFDFSRFLSMD